MIFTKEGNNSTLTCHFSTLTGHSCTLTMIINGDEKKISAQKLNKHKQNVTNLTALQVWLSGESHLKEVLYWGSHNLVNFPFLAPPSRLCVCTYLVLSNWCFTLCVLILYSFCLLSPNPTYQYVTPHLVF